MAKSPSPRYRVGLVVLYEGDPAIITHIPTDRHLLCLTVFPPDSHPRYVQCYPEETTPTGL